jgi:predicted secreted Zn-dependent protease
MLIIQTNFYAVSGSDPWELRADIRRKRPWKDEVDGFTRWKIDWSFTSASSDSDCRLQSLQLKTDITITIPKWTPPEEATARLKQRWSAYVVALLAHEEGHKRIVLAATKEVRKRLTELRAARTCDELDAIIKREATRIIESCEKRGKLYDEQTGNGRSQGASFP